MADLWQRLQAAKARADAAPADAEAEAPASVPPVPEPAPPGWSWVTPLVAERRLSFGLEPRFWKAVEPTIDAASWKQVRCFDTETTGLSGGAGTVAFLVGWATLVLPTEDQTVPEVEVRQWFLRDLPGEPELVAAVDGALVDSRGLVSFNGASFDLPLLRSRWALAGRPFPELPHRDDLHPARRLWKRLLDSCRLSRIEETVLGICRTDDVPGALVPALWFDYLRQGALADFVTPLEGVLRHHAQDVYSLLCLDLLLDSLIRDPTAPRWKATFGPFPERRPLARPAPGGLLHPDLGKETPVDFWGLGDLKAEEARDQDLETSWEARRDEALGLAWAERLKRRRDPRAKDVWAELWGKFRSFPALEEQLKWLEHRDRTPEARLEARRLIDQALSMPFVPHHWTVNLERRRQRLEAKDPGPAGSPSGSL